MKQTPLSVFWISFVVILLGSVLVIRLVDQSQLLSEFPLDRVNDVSSYMAQLFFLDQCGFHQPCPYWYNGFTAFLITPPGWFFFALPLYKIFGDVKIATYASMVLLFLISFLTIFYFGRRFFHFTLVQRLAFFTLFFGNAIAIGNFIRLGRVHELFAWTIFLLLAFFILYYNHAEIPWSFFFLSFIYAGLLLSYLAIGIMVGLLFIGLFLVKSTVRERVIITLTILASFALSSFWIIPFVLNINQSFIPYERHSEWLFDFSPEHFFTNIAVTIVPLLLFVVFYFVYRTTSRRRELLVYSPILLLGFLLLTRLVVFVPVFNKIWQDPYLVFFSFFLLFLFFRINWTTLSPLIRYTALFCLVAFSLLSAAFSLFYTPYFIHHTDLDRDVLSLLSFVDDRFLYHAVSDELPYSKALFSYAPVYHNLTTAGGWYHHLKTPAYLDYLQTLELAFRSQDCSLFYTTAHTVNTPYHLSYDSGCSFLNSCGFKLIRQERRACLYHL